MKSRIVAMVLEAMDRLLMAYERATPCINQQLVGQVLSAMEKVRRAAR